MNPRFGAETRSRMTLPSPTGPPASPIASLTDPARYAGRTVDGTRWVCFDPGGEWVAAAQAGPDGWIVALVGRKEPSRAIVLNTGLAEPEAVSHARTVAAALFHTGAAPLPWDEEEDERLPG